MGLEYVDIFYSHRPDRGTPLEETMGALAHAVRSGKALYAGISNYPAKDTARAIEILRSEGVPCLIHQPKYSMLDRWVEKDLLTLLEREGVGCIPFSPLAQGLLSNKYLKGIPEDSRAASKHGFLQASAITKQLLSKLSELNQVALNRDQSLAQLALSWILKDKRITSVLVGVSSVIQLKDNLAALQKTTFTEDELIRIDKILSK
jgi:L-glyceraldehyde 3-phosphate reductase